MAQVTGYTAARMREIENSAIVGGLIVGDDLVLTRYDGQEITAGNVRGPLGSKGDTGEVTQAELDAAVTSFSVPPGTLLDFTGDTPPSADWVIPTGQFVEIGDNPELYGLYGTKYGAISGSQFRLPDLTGLFTVNKGNDTWNNALGNSGGSPDAVNVLHDHDLTGTFTTTPKGGHNHGMGTHPILYEDSNLNFNAYGLNAGVGNAGFSADFEWDGVHDHNVTLSGDTGIRGEVGTGKNLPPYFVVVKILRLG